MVIDNVARPNYIVNEDEGLSPCPWTADRVEDSMSDDDRKDLFEEQCPQEPRKQGQADVVQLKPKVQLHGWPGPHKLSTGEYDDIVRDNRRYNFLPCRQECFTRHKLKV